MRNPYVRASVFLAAGIVAVIATLAGCESDPETTDLDKFFADNPYVSDPRVDGGNALSVTPKTVNVSHIGETVNFRVQGGEGPYTWAVANTSRGSIIRNPPASSTSVYTVNKVGPNNVIVADSIGHSVIADITASGVGALAIIPSATTLTASETNGLPMSLNGTIVNFQATGGVPPYGSWHVSNPNLGTITAGGVYTVDGTWGTGVNTISISDSAGKTATTTITIQLAD